MYSVRGILESVKSGKVSIGKAEDLLRVDAVKIIRDIARIDVSRYRRRGVPEIIYAPGKSTSQLIDIVTSLVVSDRNSDLRVPIIISRISGHPAIDLKKCLLALRPKYSKKKFNFVYHESAKVMVIQFDERIIPNSAGESGRVALICAGTSDIAILDEAEIVLNLSGCETVRFNDVGVAGLHRLKMPLEKIRKFDPDVLIVAAGMEGALPSVIAGLSDIPVIGVPVSVGYGFGRNGEAAMMSMLQACPLGIAIVNIDAGIAAGVVGSLFAHRCAKLRTRE